VENTHTHTHIFIKYVLFHVHFWDYSTTPSADTASNEIRISHGIMTSISRISSSVEILNLFRLSTWL